MNRRDFIKNLGVGAASLAVGGCNDSFGAKKLFSSESVDVKIAARGGGQPNVVFILTDDQGYGDLACHGNPIIKTPAIDKLHSQSTRLTNYHVGPTCAPTRAGLITGRYCNRTGVWHTIMGRSILRKDEVTMADVFKAGGYKTGIFGKWHLGDNYPFRPQDRGFDEVVVNGGGGVTQTPDYWCNDYFDDTYYHNGVPQHYDGYCTDVWFNNAMKFIEDNKNKRFFCYIPTNAPHSPTNVESKYSQPYKNNNNVPEADFYGMIANIDENVAKMDAHLKNLGLDGNTILIFMTDNGTASGYSGGKGFNAGMRGIKGSPYDGGHRVPFFIRWPDGAISSGRDIDKLTAHIDILPTLIDLCGISAPDVQFDGTSLKPLLFDTGINWPDRVIVTDSQRVENPIKWRQSATMTDQWRLVNGTELYDIKADPGQNNNIASTHSDVVADLRMEYEKWWASVSTHFDEYSRTIIGNDAENPVRLTGHDGHGASPPWSQSIIRSGPKTEYFWAVEIERDGDYEFELRRWPAEVNQPITAGVPAGGPVPGGTAYAAGAALNIVSARLKIGNIDISKAVGSVDVAATFRATLTAGPAELRAWFTDGGGVSRSAYYVYAKRL